MSSWVDLQVEILQDFVDVARSARQVREAKARTHVVDGEDPRVARKVKKADDRRRLRAADRELKTVRAVRRLLGITRPWYDAPTPTPSSSGERSAA